MKNINIDSQDISNLSDSNITKLTFDKFKKLVHTRKWDKKLDWDGIIYPYKSTITWNCVDMVAWWKNIKDSQYKLWMRIPKNWRGYFPYISEIEWIKPN